MKKLLVVVDMQKDFVGGSLGTKEAACIVPKVAEKIEKALKEGWEVIFTKDTHGDDYLTTQEGKKLPVVHCIKGSDGWELIPELSQYEKQYPVVEKPGFGSKELAERVAKGGFEEAELIGLCTDICVISNALLLKAADPELVVRVDSACCAGVTPESHKNALEAMKMCQVIVE
jgi:nicotinamidase-related amidase